MEEERMDYEKSIDEMLEEEIRDELEELNTIEVGSDKYKVAVDGITKLYEKQIEVKKFNADQEQKRKAQEATERQIELDERDRKIKNKLTGASIGVPALVTIGGTALMLWYEIGKDGLISSLAGKGIIQRLIGRK